MTRSVFVLRFAASDNVSLDFWYPHIILTDTSTSSNRQPLGRLHDRSFHSITCNPFLHSICVYVRLSGSTTSCAEPAHCPVMTSHQNAGGLVSNFKQGPTDDDAKGSASLQRLHAATAYTSSHGSTLLRCLDEAEAELKALLRPLTAHRIEVASSSSD